MPVVRGKKGLCAKFQSSCSRVWNDGFSCDSKCRENQFEVFTGAMSDNDDEDEVMMALQQLTSKITVGPKPSQKQRKKKVQPKPLSPEVIATIVAALKSGDLTLKDLDSTPCTDDDLVEIYALVDSGAGAHTANAAKHFPGAMVTESAAQRAGVKYITANEEEITNDGEMSIPAITEHGDEFPLTFQNTSVGMPIISVAQMAHDYDSKFRKKDGEFIHQRTGKVLPFVKRHGVYFMKLLVPRSLAPSDSKRAEAFGRPEN